MGGLIGRWLRLAVLGSVLFGGALVPCGQAAAQRLPGDLNGDGQTTIADVLRALRYTLRLDSYTQDLLPALDLAPVNADGSYGDGSVNIGDALILLRRVVRLDTAPIWPGDRYYAEPPPTPPAVGLVMPREPLFVGSYVRVPVRVDPASGLTFGDLDFLVPEGPKGGMVSLSRDRLFNAKEPTVMLGAGYQPGVYRLQALKSATNTVVAEEKFEVTDTWKEERAGPSLWFTGVTGEHNAGAAWGGGPAGPQNLGTVTASGTRRIALLFVDTSSSRYPTDAPTLQSYRDRWLDAAVNGVTEGGVTRSSNLYYREVSYNGFSLSAQAFGPVSLPNSWDTYYKSDGTPKGSFWQSVLTAADGLIDYTQFDTVVCVLQHVPATATDPVKFAWPYASIGSWGPYTTAEGNRNLGLISMPNDWETLDGSGRRIFQTLSHELGHNLGLGDQYTPSVAGRNPGAWELMHWEGSLPDFSLAHRMMLGWVPGAWIQPYNFASMAAPVDQTITLSPIELGAPPAGRKAGIEIRLADGWNYYLEYRNGQVTQIADQALPTDDRVLGTDVVSPPYTPPIARPTVLLLPNDPDGDGAVLGNGANYRETDFTDPTYPTDFRVDVSGVDGTKADVRIRYGVNSKPDPSIRPWPAGPNRQWQSPDIEVKNARNQADPANWFNVPWEGNPNTVVATIKNNGNLDAPGVVANFYVKDYTVGGAPETYLGTDTHDIPKNGTVEFTTSWTPPSSGHFCIVVRIPLYLVPGAVPAVAEMTELNNVAQSNYDRFISRTASPSSREITEVKVGNPYSEPTLVHIVPGQNNPLYRTYLEHTWLWLDPGEVRSVAVMFEYAGQEFLRDALRFGTQKEAEQARQQLEKMRRVPNRVGMRALVEDPRDSPRHSIDTLGGVEAEIVEGRKTQFLRFNADGDVLVGVVAMADTQEPAPDGTVLLTLAYPGQKPDQPVLVNQSTPLSKGQFVARVRSGWLTARAYYLPPPGIADATSDTLPNRSLTPPPPPIIIVPPTLPPILGG